MCQHFNMKENLIDYYFEITYNLNNMIDFRQGLRTRAKYINYLILIIE